MKYLHVITGQDGSLCYLVKSNSRSKKRALAAVEKRAMSFMKRKGKQFMFDGTLKEHVAVEMSQIKSHKIVNLSKKKNIDTVAYWHSSF